jgi:Flp pilus assembly protein TadG
MIRRWLHRLRHNRRGTTTLEYALLMPLLFGVIFVSIEITFILFADASLESAANNVARAGRIGITDASGNVVRPNCDQLKNMLIANLPGWVHSKDLAFNVTVYHANDTPPSTTSQCNATTSSTGNPGDMAIYTFSVERTGFTGFITWVIGSNPLKISRSILVQNEL